MFPVIPGVIPASHVCWDAGNDDDKVGLAFNIVFGSNESVLLGTTFMNPDWSNWGPVNDPTAIEALADNQ